ncbi:MAG TPA: MBL fold metallo-hydrolase [Xanthomonadaceae bacterium]|nr:MBL fold metallo-hydrolase [Xanthomonadaceae bacterium]
MSPVVTPFFHEDTATFTYVVADPERLVAAVIDPVLDYDAAAARTGRDSIDAVIAHLKAHRLRVDWILETHAHADHLSAAPLLKAACGGCIAIGQGIRRVQATFRDIYHLGHEFPVDGSQFDHLFAEGETFHVGGIDARAIPTPGHTSDSLSYLIGDAVFVGDSLFMPDGGSARCDFPGGSAAELYASAQRLFELPDDTRVFVCHDYQPDGRELRCETTIGEQKRANIHLREGVSEAEFVATRNARDATLGMPRLILPAIQVNIRAGELPAPEDNGQRYLKIPLNRFGG